MLSTLETLNVDDPTETSQPSGKKTMYQVASALVFLAGWDLLNRVAALLIATLSLSTRKLT